MADELYKITYKVSDDGEPIVIPILADEAEKIGEEDVGTSTQPVYIKAGVPTATDSTLDKDISGNAASATKLKTARTVVTNLASADSASFDGTTNIEPGVEGVLPIANGGTGASDLAKVNVGSATKLETARTVITNLASTDSASFDGSKNIEPGVEGTLPVANGGTGQTDLDDVTVGTAKRVGSATVGGVKVPIYNNAGTLTKLGDGTNDVGSDTYPIYMTKDGELTQVASELAKKSELSDGTVTKIGTANVGTSTEPIYIKAGVPTATDDKLDKDISGNAATATKLETARNLKVNLATDSAQSFDGSSAAESIGVTGVLPASHGGLGSETIGGVNTPIYNKAGTLTPLGDGENDVGDDVSPIYMKKDGTLTKVAKPLALESALSDGSVTKVGTADVGGVTTPIYNKAGTLTPLGDGSTDLGSNTYPIYMTKDGVLTKVANELAVKSALTDGSVTKVGTANVGATNVPIYLKAGVPTKIGDGTNTIGSDTYPIYVNTDGTLTAVTSELAQKSYVNGLTYLTHDNLEGIIGDASSSNNGLMKSDDYDALVKVVSEALRNENGYANAVALTMDDEYKIKVTLSNVNGDVISTSETIDLPLEELIVDGKYDADNKKIILYFNSDEDEENGDNREPLEIPVGDLIDGLASESDLENYAKLSASNIFTGKTQTIKNQYPRLVLTNTDSAAANQLFLGVASSNVWGLGDNINNTVRWLVYANNGDFYADTTQPIPRIAWNDTGDISTPVYFAGGIPVACTNVATKDDISAIVFPAYTMTYDKDAHTISLLKDSAIVGSAINLATVIGTASSSNDGLMTSDMYKKLEGLESGTTLTSAGSSTNPIYIDSTGSPTAIFSGNSTAIGQQYVTAKSSGHAVAVGYRTYADGSYSVASGYYTYAEGDHSVAIGSGSSGTHLTAEGDYTVALGYNAHAGGEGITGSIAMGNGATANYEDSIAIGTGVKTTKAGEVIIGDINLTELKELVEKLEQLIKVGEDTATQLVFEAE